MSRHILSVAHYLSESKVVEKKETYFTGQENSKILYLLRKLNRLAKLGSDRMGQG